MFSVFFSSLLYFSLLKPVKPAPLSLSFGFPLSLTPPRVHVVVASVWVVGGYSVGVFPCSGRLVARTGTAFLRAESWGSGGTAQRIPGGQVSTRLHPTLTVRELAFTLFHTAEHCFKETLAFVPFQLKQRWINQHRLLPCTESLFLTRSLSEQICIGPWPWVTLFEWITWRMNPHQSLECTECLSLSLFLFF